MTESNTTANATITVEEAMKQLQISDEVEFRALLFESHPDNWDLIAFISLSEFELIVKTLQAKKQGLAIAPEILAVPELAVPQQELIITSVSNALADFADSYAVDIVQLSNVLAYVTAQRALANFQGTFESTLNQGLNNYAGGLTDSLVSQIHQVAGLDNADFLERQGVKPQGIKPNSNKVLEAMKVIEDLQSC